MTENPFARQIRILLPIWYRDLMTASDEELKAWAVTFELVVALRENWDVPNELSKKMGDKNKNG